MFRIFACWTCFSFFIGHVTPMYVLLRYHYPITKKIKKGQPKLEHKILGTNVVGKHWKPFLQNVIFGYHMRSMIVETY